ncbi:acyl-CoA dehydrogenase family protein [Fodinicurvata sp. EGI_FJ10296]|uniref:acyl-CoA dehydrogenase family protein n=1 Tax=Fodinicurvata sp. EGI_FJ10296 TaxID=3231908 RepID=UPI0034514F65
MNPFAPRATLATHEVTNQPVPPAALSLWDDDRVLRDLVVQGAPELAERVVVFAAEIGSARSLDDGRLANRFPPELVTFDRGGRRIDEVSFHPGYHALMEKGISAGYCALPWTVAKGGHLAHGAMVYLMSQVEPGVCCPMTMTYAAVPALSASPEAMAPWTAGCLSGRYDSSSQPAAAKAGLTIGMAMTEKQGGSDLRGTTTRAQPVGDAFRLVGHKWFCSAPMSDAFLTLARVDQKLTAFLVPRWTPDGDRNAIHLMRLKDKLGNRANASSEIEYHGAWAVPVGEPGRGIATILEMVHHTRLDTCLAPAGLMRRALVEAVWWTRHRTAFGKPLADHPLMTAVLADLALDWQAALTLGLRVAEAFDNSGDAEERAFARLAVALAKYWSNKRCPVVVAEAMECLGGMGYVEDTPMPWLYREAPLNGIWEGTGNVICLDILRTVSKVPESLAALHRELERAAGADQRYDAALKAAIVRWSGGVAENDARRFAETMARLLQAGLLIRRGDPVVAEAFVASRLAGDWGQAPGTLAPGTDCGHILSLV